MDTHTSVISAGQRIGHWLVIVVNGRRATVRCRCGQIREVALDALIDKSSVSCGCSPLSLPKNNSSRVFRIPLGDRSADGNERLPPTARQS
jgi:hypothetical protein